MKPLGSRDAYAASDSVEERAHLVYCTRRMLLDKERYDNWQQIANTYTDYVASLGPWIQREIVHYFNDDYGMDDTQWPFSRAAIATFFQSSDRVLSREHA